MLAWELGQDGSWHRPTATGSINVQTLLERAALERARRVVAV